MPSNLSLIGEESDVTPVVSRPRRSGIAIAQKWLAVKIMNRSQSDRTISGGFTVVELLVLVAVIAIVTATGTSFHLSFQRAQATTGAARELVAALGQARQLAITRYTSFR